MQLLEHCDVRTLATIVEHWTYYPVGEGFDARTNSVVAGEALRKMVLAYLAKVYKGIPITYKQTSQSGVSNNRTTHGRMISRGLSLQGMARPIRHTILVNYERDGRVPLDIDMENCHVVALEQYCNKNNIPCDNLRDYIENKKEFRVAMATHFDWSIDEAKKRLLAVMNGSELKNKEHEYEPLAKFAAGIKVIQQEVKKLNEWAYKQALRSKGEQGYNILGSTMNRVLCDIENTLLMSIVDMIKNRSDSEVLSLQFDGLLIMVDKDADVSDILKQGENAMKGCGYDMRLSVKEFNEAFPIDPEHLMNVDIDKVIEEVDAEFQNLKDIGRVLDSDITRYMASTGLYYYYDAGTWLIFHEGRWISDPNEVTIIKHIDKILSDISDKSKPETFISSVIQGLKRRVTIESGFDEDPEYLGMVDGYINLKTGELFPYNKDVKISKCTGYTYSDVLDKENMEFALSVIEKTLPNPDNRHYVMKMLAQGLYGVAAPEMQIWIGEGCNGKSLLVNTLVRALGDYGTLAAPEILSYTGMPGSPNPSMVNLSGKRIIALEEPSAQVSLNEAILKRLVGADTIIARTLHSKKTTHPFIGNLVLCCNTLQNIDSLTGGGRRRIRVIDFPSKFVDGEEDPGMHIYKLDPDLSGNRSTKEKFAKGLLGLCITEAKGMVYQKNIPPPGDVVEKCREFFDNQSPYKVWLDEYVKPCWCEGSCIHNAKVGTLYENFINSKQYNSMCRADKRKASRKMFIDSINAVDGMADKYVVVDKYNKKLTIPECYWAGFTDLKGQVIY